MFEFLDFFKRNEEITPVNDNTNLEQMISLDKMIEIADKLDKIQSTENDGRGVSCVRTVISCLRSGDFNGAIAVCQNEHDKIENYPDIEKLLDEHGLKFKTPA